MNCCNKIYRLCDNVNPCDLDSLADLLVDLLPADGAYTLRLDFLGLCKEYEVEKAGSEVTVTGDLLNESYVYTGQLFDSNGDKVLIDTDHDCITFKTTICLSI